MTGGLLWRSRIAALVVMAAFGWCAAGCSCTEIGCVDGFTATVTVVLPGTPRSVRVQQMVDGNAILDRTLTSTYKANAPNGTSWGPTCHEATAELTIP
jgi:hypothetical protein